MHGHSLNRRDSRRMFAATAGNVRKVNSARPPMRGGYRF